MADNQRVQAGTATTTPTVIKLPPGVNTVRIKNRGTTNVLRVSVHEVTGEGEFDYLDPGDVEAYASMGGEIRTITVYASASTTDFVVSPVVGDSRKAG